VGDNLAVAAIAIRGESLEVNVALDMLELMRARIMPMLELVAKEYRPRVPEGFPMVVDAVENGLIGIEIDPNYALYITTDGEQLFADVYHRSTRADARSSAMREKFSGAPVYDRRPLPAHATDQQLRNLIAEIMARHNYQPGLVHISDS
jgi:hypothetical protein